jgi:hypothetical protein
MHFQAILSWKTDKKPTKKTPKLVNFLVASHFQGIFDRRDNFSAGFLNIN